MANVLIIASDRMIGGLMGHLTDLTGHAAQFRRDGENVCDAVLESLPDVVMVDATYGDRAIDLVGQAATEIGAAVILFAATTTPTELRRQALGRGAKYFALPAGPKLLGRVLSAALDDRMQPQTRDGGGVRTDPDRWALAEEAVSSAYVAVARARALVAQSSSTRAASRSLRWHREALLDDCRRRRAELREAVIAYTHELRGAGVPPERTIEMVKDALRTEVGGSKPAQTGVDLDDAVEWCLHAYFAA